MKLRNALLGASALVCAGAVAHATEITIATVNNSDMIIMQELSSKWEEATGNTINWVVLEENVLRQRVTTDIATGSGSFDIITIGAYEAPIWGAQDWLVALDDLGDDYNYDDIFEPVRNGLSANGTLYAVPFYAESSFTFYRTDLFEAAGIDAPTEQITYEQFEDMVAKLHDPDNGVFGTCQRGKAGWGENMAFVGPLVNAFGGRWFDMDWNPTIDSEEWRNALNYYVDLMNAYGPPGASSNGHNENRALFADGKCATWVDATSAAGYIFNPDESSVADKTGFFQAPKQVTDKGTGWFWAWALAIPTSSQHVEAAKEFLKPGRPPPTTSRWSARRRAGSPPLRAPASRPMRTKPTPRPRPSPRPSAPRSSRPTPPTPPPSRCLTRASSSSRSPSSRASATSSASRSPRRSPVSRASIRRWPTASPSPCAR
jgi:ABC-type glycerol-3-phosphate transport system substrate-binding protein